jgi:hypothetical protein
VVAADKYFMGDLYKVMSLPIIYKNYKQNHGFNDIYKIGSYEIFLNNKIGTGGYSTVYVGRCIDSNLATKLNINNSLKLNGSLVNNVVAIKKIISKGLSLKYQKMVSEETKIMQYIKDNPHRYVL